MMTYQSFGVIAIKAIQEQQQIIVQQNNSISALEADLQLLKESFLKKN